MGIGRVDLDCLLSLARRCFLPARSAVAEIGAQQLSKSAVRDRTILAELAKHFCIDGSFPIVAQQSSTPSEPERLDNTDPLARIFWEWLGFEYLAIDIDGSPGSVPLDLNCDELPAEFKGRFQLVTNFGTTEHVANQPKITMR
jgi:hypothetical protein